MAHILDIVRSALVDLLVIGVILAVPIVLLMAWRSARRPQLVVAELLNSSGHSDLDTATRGLTQLARQQIDAELRVVSERRKELYDALGGAASDRPDPGGVRRGRYGKRVKRAPGRVQVRLDEQLDQLLTATREVAPQQAQAAVQFLTVLVSRPHGLLVSGILQCRGTAGPLWGVTFDVLRIDTNRSVASQTFWEPDAQTVADGDNEQAQPDSRQGNADMTHEHILRLLGPAGRWLAIQLVLESVFPGGARGREKGLDRLLSGILYRQSTDSFPGFSDVFLRLALADLRDAKRGLDEIPKKSLDKVPLRLAALADTLDELAASAPEGVALGDESPAAIYRQAHAVYARALEAMAVPGTPDLLRQRYRVREATSWLSSGLKEPQRRAVGWLEEGGPDLTGQLAADDLYDAALLYIQAAQLKKNRQWGEKAVLLLRRALACDADTQDREIWAKAESGGLPTTELAEGLLGDTQAAVSLSRDKLDHIIDQLLTSEGNRNT
jgi:hypothetical protein